MIVQRPLPRVDADSRPYWSAAARGELQAQECDGCGLIRNPPRLLCPACWSPEATWVSLSGKGVVHTFTIVRRAPSPAFANAVPYAVALVDLEEDVRIVSNIVESDLDAIEVGSPVEVLFEPLTDEIGLPQFKLMTREA